MYQYTVYHVSDLGYVCTGIYKDVQKIVLHKAVLFITVFKMSKILNKLRAN